MKIIKKNFIQGATLAEVVVVVGITAFIVTAIATFSADIFKFSGSIQNSLQAQQDARNVLRQLASELRTASPSSTGAYPIAEATANRLRFYSDIDNDGLKEEIVYYLSADSKNLFKDIRKPSGAPLQYTASFTTSTVVNNVKNGVTALFTYYDTNYDGTSSPLSQPLSVSLVRLVRAEIIIESDPNRSPLPINVTTQVALRNLKDNL